MSTTRDTETPSIAELLAPILRHMPEEWVPLLLAIAERLAGERYRGWAAAAHDDDIRARLVACAEREEEIARRVEALHTNATTIKKEILATHPDLTELNRSIFAGRPLRQQLTMQAEGERLGAATWRSFAAKDEATRDIFLSCADLEEQSARVLESLLAAPGWPFD